jgi:hypothetical protein
MDVPKLVSLSSAVVILMRNVYLYQIFETYILKFSIMDVIVKRGPAIPVTAVEAHRVVRRRGSHIF